MARIAGSSCQDQKPKAKSQKPKAAAKAKAIGRLRRTTKRINQISGENKNPGNDESSLDQHPSSATPAKPASGPFFGYFLWANKESDPHAVAGGKADPQGRELALLPPIALTLFPHQQSFRPLRVRVTFS
ncbi:hypothetical protein [Luteimonas cucumeris]|uniref:hypothetical protein n=1 Tax=Luteimonas cucumeris TaxID=985012 RepID=UPI0011A80ECE|nr:hypothetical protein [Luteimonas cucumeris]